MRTGEEGILLARRVLVSGIAVVSIYAAHWFMTDLAATALGQGDHPNFECWGRTVQSGRYSGYCFAAWGGWSVAMYLPELALAAAAGAALLTRSFRVWKWGLAAAACSLVVFLIFVGATHLWAINQMPVIWPHF